jgi:hypothetical protein
MIRLDVPHSFRAKEATFSAVESVRHRVDGIRYEQRSVTPHDHAIHEGLLVDYIHADVNAVLVPLRACNRRNRKQ